MEETMDRSTPTSDQHNVPAYVRELDGDTFAAELSTELNWFALAVDVCVEPIRQQQLRPRPTTLDDLFNVLA